MLNCEILLYTVVSKTISLKADRGTLILPLCLSVSSSYKLRYFGLELLDSVSSSVPHLIYDHGKIIPFTKELLSHKMSLYAMLQAKAWLYAQMADEPLRPIFVKQVVYIGSSCWQIPSALPAGDPSSHTGGTPALLFALCQACMWQSWESRCDILQVAGLNKVWWSLSALQARACLGAWCKQWTELEFASQASVLHLICPWKQFLEQMVYLWFTDLLYRLALEPSLCSHRGGALLLYRNAPHALAWTTPTYKTGSTMTSDYVNAII